MAWLARLRRAAAPQEEAAVMALYDQAQTLEGEVISFDPHVGLGMVRLRSKPTCDVRFHCITIDDGSRAIGVGCRVLVRLKPSFGGELEVAMLHKLG
ncbi:hypothetical protein [Ferrimicrobium sp.]|uniref:hypothetical protein n=1 Tax=Ferrimicrobium sp. TaxID=2926050 RepID=UPI0026231834|nr:hypothetical protein [Ferrimicrobium sp.]